MIDASGSALIGIDIGTTNLKIVAIRPDGDLLSVVRRPMQIDRPEPGAAEFNLDKLDADLLGGLAQTVERLAAAGVRPNAVAAIGVCSIGESYVGLDAEGRRTTPCPTWFDRRTENRRSRWSISAREWFELTGMVDDDIYTIHRLGRVRALSGDDFRRTAKWAMVADYATYVLSGLLAANPSLAARSGLADRRRGVWSDDLLGAIGLAASNFPELRRQGESVGQLDAAVAATTGLVAGAPVVNAGHDHPCAGFACRLVDSGPVVDSTGTSEALKTVVDRPLGYDEVGGGRYDCYPYVTSDRFILSGHIPASGALLDWLERLLAGPSPTPAAIDAIWRAAAEAPPGADGVRVLPFLRGSGAPWNERFRRAEITGLGDEASAGAILRAAVEGLAAWLAVNVERFGAMTGHDADELILAGGGARNAFVDRLKAAFIGRRLVIPTVEEAAGVGAALAAGLATGVFASPAEAVRLSAVAETTIEVDPILADAYARLGPQLVNRLDGRGS
jgi:sugar (pentulose or hexulose) kinase